MFASWRIRSLATLTCLCAAALLLVGCTLAVPDVRGMTVAEATKAIQSGGLVLGSVTEGFDLTAPAGEVIKQEPPAGDAAAKYDEVSLTVSQGPEPQTP